MISFIIWSNKPVNYIDFKIQLFINASWKLIPVKKHREFVKNKSSSPFSLFIGLTIHFTSRCNVVLTTRLSHMITESNLSRSWGSAGQHISVALNYNCTDVKRNTSPTLHLSNQISIWLSGFDCKVDTPSLFTDAFFVCVREWEVRSWSLWRQLSHTNAQPGSYI